MNSRIARIATPVLGIALLGGTVFAATAVPAAAAAGAAGAGTAPMTAKAAPAKAAPTKKTSKVVTTREISKFKLSKRSLKDIDKATKFANTKKAKQIRQRESHSRYTINTGNGYYGAYQFDKRTWRVNGGAKFSSTANKAPKWAQDYVMWRAHKSHGWGPWGG